MFSRVPFSSQHSLSSQTRSSSRADLLFFVASLLFPSSALLTSGVTAGQWVAIPGGGGGLGHLAIQYANAMGARVIAVDLPSKEKFCRETCGAEEFVDATSASLVDDVVRITGGGPHVT